MLADILCQQCGEEMRRKNLLATAVIGAIFLLYHAGGFSAEHRTARYTTIAMSATADQKNPMRATVHTQFTDQVRSVGEAFQQILSRSGYRMAHIGASDPRLSALLQSPLPEVHRQLGPLRLSDALSTLAGAPWELVVDPVHRLVSFDLKQPYARSVSTLDSPCETLSLPERHAQE